MDLHTLGLKTKRSSQRLRTVSTEQKQEILRAMAVEIMKNQESIREANAQDLAMAEEKGLSGAMLDRLTLTGDRIKAMGGQLKRGGRITGPCG